MREATATKTVCLTTVWRNNTQHFGGKQYTRFVVGKLQVQTKATALCSGDRLVIEMCRFFFLATHIPCYPLPSPLPCVPALNFVQLLTSSHNEVTCSKLFIQSTWILAKHLILSSKLAQTTKHSIHVGHCNNSHLEHKELKTLTTWIITEMIFHINQYFIIAEKSEMLQFTLLFLYLYRNILFTLSAALLSPLSHLPWWICLKICFIKTW